MKSSETKQPESDRQKPWMNWLKRGITVFFFILIPVLLFMLLRNVDWSEVLEALRGYSAVTLLIGVGIAAISFLVFSSYDLLGKAYTEHQLPAKQVLPLAFVCYAFNLNFGAWIGGFALRFRLYSRLGLSAGVITRVVSLSIITNWLGYMVLAGTVFSMGMMPLPADWEIGATGLQLIGFALLAVSAIYLLACRFSRRRKWSWRDHEIVLPTFKFALLQATLGAVNWSLMAALIFLLLPEGVFFPMVLGILLVSSIAGVITHIPGGLGVLEAVFIALLQHQIAPAVLLATLITYRAIYFLLPLAVAALIYVVLEKRAKTMQAANEKTESAGDPNSGARSEEKCSQRRQVQ